MFLMEESFSRFLFCKTSFFLSLKLWQSYWMRFGIEVWSWKATNGYKDFFKHISSGYGRWSVLLLFDVHFDIKFSWYRQFINIAQRFEHHQYKHAFKTINELMRTSLGHSKVKLHGTDVFNIYFGSEIKIESTVPPTKKVSHN